VRRALRSTRELTPEDAVVGEIGPGTQWRDALDGIDAVVHLAARTHIIRDKAEDPLAAYRRINVSGTMRLAEYAVEFGVRKFVFMSSIKVNGETTDTVPFRETDAPRPEDAYGETKLEAETLLAERTRGSNMALATLRPPLVYGAGVKGNLLRLMTLLARRTPLPLASIDNRRSLISVENLASAVVACLDSTRSDNRTYLIADGEDISTPELVRVIAVGLGVKPRLVRCPVPLLDALAALAGRRAEAARLTRSLQVDSNLIRRELAWSPAQSLALGMGEMVRWYNASFCARAIAE
jgi:nucleoside-diphosphate-sugar epimerase